MTTRVNHKVTICHRQDVFVAMDPVSGAERVGPCLNNTITGNFDQKRGAAADLSPLFQGSPLAGLSFLLAVAVFTSITPTLSLAFLPSRQSAVSTDIF